MRKIKLRAFRKGAQLASGRARFLYLRSTCGGFKLAGRNSLSWKASLDVQKTQLDLKHRQTYGPSRAQYLGSEFVWRWSLMEGFRQNIIKKQTPDFPAWNRVQQDFAHAKEISAALSTDPETWAVCLMPGFEAAFLAWMGKAGKWRRQGSADAPPLRRPHTCLGDTKVTLMKYSSFCIRNGNVATSLSPR